MNTSSMKPPVRSGFALIITLIMLVLAAVVAVTLLTTTTLDRTTAKSVSLRYQAETAVSNGLEAAKKALMASPNVTTPVVGDDTFVVLRADGTQGPNSNGNKDAYYFLAKAKPRDAAGVSSTVDCYPLFSGGTSSTLTIDHINYPPLQRPSVPTAAFTYPALDAAGKPYPRLYPFQQPVFTQWQEIRDPKDTAAPPAHNLPYQRYTYWIEDLSAYLDAGAVGNTAGPGAVHQRGNGTNPNEIALFTLFKPVLNADDGSTLAKLLIDNRPLLFTVPTLSQVAYPPPSGTIDETQPNMGSAFGTDIGGERSFIPFGFGFLDEGTSKTNLNSVISSSSSADEKVSALAKVINDNLPMFGTKRKGGLASTEDYVKTLAANVLDYADADSTPTVGTNYRGLDLYPFVVEFYERFIWQKNGNETTNFYLKNGTWWADVKVTGYIQLWNMSNKVIDSGTFTFQDINRYYAYVGGTSDAHKFEDSFSTGTIAFSSSESLQSNEFKVFQIYENVYNFNTELTIRPTGTAATAYLGSESGNKIPPLTCGYFSSWNGVRVDRPGAGTLDGARGDASDKYPGLNYMGLERDYIALSTPGSAYNPKWKGTLPGLRYDALNESVYNLGDPRSAYYIARIQANSKYAKDITNSADTDGNSAWWGRMYQKYLIADSAKWFAAETLPSIWPDGDHSTGSGLLPKDNTVDPLSIPGARPATESTKAPQYFSNAGRFDSTTEIGHIFDPIQWRPSNFSTKPTSSAEVATVWRDAWKNDLVSDGNYGDASTLRIGSPEFKTFDTDESRAARLLDLFSTNDRVNTKGLVNLNTASREVLRTLGAGIQMGQDPGIVPITVFGPTDSIQADKFADAVIASRPFLSTSQLSGILQTPTDATSKFFGNASRWTAGAPTEWTDSAREEYFSRMFNLTSIRSRNFRVFVTGQSLDKNENVLSTVNRVYQVFLSPTRDDTSGAITSQRVQITYEKDL